MMTEEMQPSDKKIPVDKECNSDGGRSELVLHQVSHPFDHINKKPKNDYIIVESVDKFKTILKGKGKSMKVPISKSLMTFIGLENSGKLEVFKKTFPFASSEDDVPAVFSHYELSAYNLETPDSIVSLPELFSSPKASELKNFEIASLAALEISQISLSLENNESSSVCLPAENEIASFTDVIHHLENVSTKEKNKGKIQSFGFGIGLVNIWDIGFNRSVRPFLESFSGCLLDNSTFLFIRWEDAQKMYAPPTIDSNILNLRPKLQYLLRPCRLSLRSQSSCCTVCITYSSSQDEMSVEKTVTNLEKLCDSAFDQMGIKETIECKVLSICTDSNSGCKRLLERVKLVTKKAQKTEISFSFLFLRCLLAHLSKECITHSELNNLAKVYADMNDDDCRDFCRIFTSFGSILDVRKINTASEFIIIKPLEYLRNLDRFLKQKDLQQYKQVPESIDKSLEFIPVLADMSIAVKLPNPNASFYFSSSIKHSDVQQKTQFTDGAIQFVLNTGAPRMNINIRVMKKLFEQLHNPSLKFEPKEANTVIIETQFDPNVDGCISVTLSFMADVIEISINAHENVKHQYIEDACVRVILAFKESVQDNKKRLNDDSSIRYNFSVLCPWDELGKTSAYSAYRLRHILPHKLCSRCHEDYKKTMPIINTWCKLLEQDKYSIPNDLKLNGALTIQKMAMLATQLSKFHWSAIEALAKELNTMVLPNDPGPRREWAIMSMLMQWEHDNYKIENDSLRRKLARKLHDTDQNWERPKGDFNEHLNLKKLARELDIQVLTDEQRKEIVAMIHAQTSPNENQ